MSLTGHLYNGALGAWCTTHLPGTGPVVDQVQAAVKGIDPVRPVGSVDRGHWATVGGAFGQRLAFVISHEPPYAGLLGAARSGLLGSRALNAICALFPSHRDLPDPYPARASELRPVPGDWADFNGAGHRCLWGLPPYADSRAQGQIEVRCSDLVEMLDDEQRAGIGKLLAFRVDEEDLAQLCLDLARWESAYRGGPPVTPTWSESSKDAVQEMVRLAARIPLADFHRLTEKLPDRAPMGFSSPTFVHRWAEGDVIVGSTLIDVKAVASVYDRPRVASWLYQLITYAWLDAADSVYAWLGDYERALATLEAAHGEVAPQLAAGPPTSAQVVSAITSQLAGMMQGHVTREGDDAQALQRIAFEVVQGEARGKRDLGKYDDAERLFLDARPIAAELGVPSAVDFHLAVIALARGDAETARRLVADIAPQCARTSVSSWNPSMWSSWPSVATAVTSFSARSASSSASLTKPMPEPTSRSRSRPRRCQTLQEWQDVRLPQERDGVVDALALEPAFSKGQHVRHAASLEGDPRLERHRLDDHRSVGKHLGCVCQSGSATLRRGAHDGWH